MAAHPFECGYLIQAISVQLHKTRRPSDHKDVKSVVQVQLVQKRNNLQSTDS